MNFTNKRNSRIRSNIKKIGLCLFIGLTQFQYVHANTVVDDWNFGNPISNGATTTWNTTKDIAGKAVTGVASIKPTPAQVAKGILKGGLVGIALTATVQLLEDGVDFILDPANNSIRYKPKDSLNNHYYYREGSEIYSAPTESAVCDLLTLNKKREYYLASGSICRQVNGSDYYPVAPLSTSSEKTVPILEIASQIITQAEAGNKEAQDYINTVAQDLLEHDEDVQKAVVAQADDSQKDSEDQPVSIPSTSGNSTNATPPPDDEDEQSNKDDSQEKIDNLLKDTQPGRNTKGRTTQYIKKGGFERANKEFDDLNLKNVKEIEPGRIGFLKNNIKVVVRNYSSEGSPTLEVQISKNNKIEIRYK